MSGNRLYQNIALKIAELIDSGAFPSGSRLPSEKRLAENFGVNRVSVREAKVALQAQGRLELKGRSGAYVLSREATSADGPPRVAALELTQARILFEAEAAALAAPNITEEAIAELEHYMAIMCGDVQSQMTAEEADAAFHNTIARATNNDMIIFVIESMWKMRTESPKLQKIYQSVCDKDSSHREDEHRLILQALKDRDSNAARQAMRGHFTRILEALIESSEKEAYQAIKQKTSEYRSRFLRVNEFS